MITNCTVTLDDTNNSNTIFGPNTSSLKEEMKSWQPNPMVSNYINIPEKIIQLHKTVSVSMPAEMMFVTGMIFLVIISRHVKFTTMQYLRKRKTGDISKSLGNINDVYYRHGMYVENFCRDREFENIRRIITGRSTLNLTTVADLVPEIE